VEKKMNRETIIPMKDSKAIPIVLVVQYGIDSTTADTAINAALECLKISKSNLFSLDCYVERDPSMHDLSYRWDNTRKFECWGKQHDLEEYLSRSKSRESRPDVLYHMSEHQLWEANKDLIDSMKLFEQFLKYRNLPGFLVILTYESVDQSKIQLLDEGEKLAPQVETEGFAARWSNIGGCAVISVSRSCGGLINEIQSTRISDSWGSAKRWLEANNSNKIYDTKFAQRYIKGICLHELGHLFGLSHCDADYCLMHSVQNRLDILVQNFCKQCRRQLIKENHNIKHVQSIYSKNIKRSTLG
jgi:hypothetical protein